MDIVIGVSGYARSGKDTMADILVAKHGFRKVSFADKLREVLYALDPIVGHYYYDKNPDMLTVQDVIDKHGWDGYKETEYGTEIRRLLQRLGTEAGRQVIDEDIWVNALFNKYRQTGRGSIVIPDTRFPNEASAIEQRYDGHIVRVNRPGINAINAHPSETALDDWPFEYCINNDGTIEDLESKVDQLMQLIVLDHS